MASVISAELRIYINSTQFNTNLAHNDNLDVTKMNNMDETSRFYIILYEIGANSSLVAIEQKEVDVHREGWLSLNVTAPLERWLRTPDNNYGLQLDCYLMSTGNHVSCKD